MSREFERDTTRDEVANQLEAFAARLREDEPIHITIDEKSFTVDPPNTVEFEIEVEDEGETIGEDVERSIELEIEWETREGEEELRKVKEKAPPFRAGMNPADDDTNHDDSTAGYSTLRNPHFQVGLYT